MQSIYNPLSINIEITPYAMRLVIQYVSKSVLNGLNMLICSHSEPKSTYVITLENCINVSGP